MELFTKQQDGEDTEAAPSAFGTASLDDCGLDPETLKVVIGSKI